MTKRVTKKYLQRWIWNCFSWGGWEFLERWLGCVQLDYMNDTWASLTGSEKMPSNKKRKRTNKNRFREEAQIFVCFISGAVQIFLFSLLKFVYSGLSAFISSSIMLVYTGRISCVHIFPLSKIGICTLPKSSTRVQWQALDVGSLTRVELWFGTCMMDTLPSEIRTTNLIIK